MPALSPVARALVVAAGGDLDAAREAALEAALGPVADELADAALAAQAAAALAPLEAMIPSLVAASGSGSFAWGLADEAAIEILALAGGSPAVPAVEVAQVLLTAAVAVYPPLGETIHNLTAV